ncbi:MAG: RNA-binding cell elongation regulator Jag/EloR [Catonella sp.]|uniref:RNA-binding cell elongation regulator Jag/EloR n=1 Tax=Catonella sp. TaxID=2382125 RepID=UPI003FA08CBD
MSNNWIEISAKTVDDAINEGLARLGTTSDKMDVEVLEKESAGFLGFIGRHDAKIRVRLKEVKPATVVEKKVVKEVKPASVRSNTETKTEEKPVADIQRKPKKKFDEIEKSEPVSADRQEKAKADAVKFLTDVFKAMKLEASINVEFDAVENELSIDVKAEDMGVLIGKRGQTLDSLQYIVSLAINKDSNEYVKVKLDSENYRIRRKETLENLAKNIASKVKRTGRQVSLEPMNSFERRIIHSALQGDPDCETFSEGSDPYRRVVVKPKGERNYYNNRYNKGYSKKPYGRKPYRKNGYNKNYTKKYEREDYAEKADVEE